MGSEDDLIGLMSIIVQVSASFGEGRPVDTMWADGTIKCLLQAQSCGSHLEATYLLITQTTTQSPDLKISKASCIFYWLKNKFPFQVDQRRRNPRGIIAPDYERWRSVGHLHT